MSFYCSLSDDNSFCLLRNLIMAKLFHSWHLMLLNALKLNNRKQLWGEISRLIHVAKGGKCNAFLLHNWDCSKGTAVQKCEVLCDCGTLRKTAKRDYIHIIPLCSHAWYVFIYSGQNYYMPLKKKKKESVLETYISHYIKLSRTFSCFDKQNSRTTIGQNIQVTTVIVT